MSGKLKLQTSITKKFTFEAMHSLPKHKGKCRNNHGHSYKLYVTISGPIKKKGSEEGMIIDFYDLSEKVKELIVDQWDHQNINELVPFTTTAENLATEAFMRIHKAGIPVTKIVLYETENNYAEVIKI